MLASGPEAATDILTIVNGDLKFPRVSLIDPSPSTFLHIAAEVDSRPAFLIGSRAKRRLLAQCKDACRQLRNEPGVVDASVFKALIAPPGLGEYARKRADRLHIARFDIAVLIECDSADSARTVQQHPAYQQMRHAIADAASYVHAVTASNPRCIGLVDHTRQGVFLFNYFVADSLAQNLAVWDYTAGWFQAETGLDNSTVLLPLDKSQSQYSIINHCRWDGLGDILPSLIFKKSFHSYVLENFTANNVAAMPILYRLA